MKIAILSLLILISPCLRAQNSLAIEIDGIYNFSPSKLTRKQQEEKMLPLDKFWDKVKEDTLIFLPQLRKELAAPGHNPFFYFDGTGLLLTLSKSKEDKHLAATAIERCDINDIDRRMYVITLNGLARDGINITHAAMKILTDDKYTFFIKEHALEYNQGYCLSYMLLPQVEDYYVDTLISTFKNASPVAKKSIVTTLWFSATCKGDAYLKIIAEDRSIDKDVRNYVKELMANKDLAKGETAMIKSLSKDDLKQIRINALHRLSDEAIDELDLTTRILRKELNCD